ncbi:MAG: methylated-DNA--[protein]-cysteine S-methyltransferase [Actinomycetota bacterium]
MNRPETHDTDGGWRELAEGLHGLRATPPATLRPAVLERVGLADAYLAVDGPAGPLLVAYNGRGISATAPGADKAAFAERFLARFGRPLRPVDRPPARLVAQVHRLLEPGRRGTPPRYDLRGTSAFEQAVLAKAQEIPRGQVRPYAWVAGELGQPAAVRAVGAALGRNPVPVLIPCHRVVGSDGRLTGYAWGVGYKRALLAAEGADPDELERLGRRGTRFYGSDTTRIYCYPTCAHARRVTGRHLQRFAGVAEAAAAGYRPCRSCRPPALAG